MRQRAANLKRKPFSSSVVIVVVTAFSLALAGAASAAAGETYTCAKCGKAIEGEYFQTNGKYFHSGCFPCASCGKPIKDAYTVYGGENYHKDCFDKNIAKKCSVCGGAIRGKYLKDRWGNLYHLSHKDEINACEYCGRYITPNITGGGIRYSDGRYICDLCREKAVTGKKEASAVMGEVARHMRRFGMDVNPGEVELRVVGLQEIQELSGRGSHRLTGFTDFKEEKNLLGMVTDRWIAVYILYGLPRMEAVSTIAHELAHVWQFRAGRLGNDRAFCEGSCNFASYLVLKKYTDPMADFLIANLVNDESEIYGEGFRRVKRFAETEGLAAWVERLGEKDELPRDY